MWLKNNIIFIIIFVVALCLNLSLRAYIDILKTDSLNLQIERNNQWNHYGTKSIKNRLCQLSRASFSLNFEQKNNEKTQILIRNLDNEINRYTEEAKDIQEQAIINDKNYQISIQLLKNLYILRSIFDLFIILFIFFVLQRSFRILK